MQMRLVIRPLCYVHYLSCCAKLLNPVENKLIFLDLQVCVYMCVSIQACNSKTEAPFHFKFVHKPGLHNILVLFQDDLAPDLDFYHFSGYFFTILARLGCLQRLCNNSKSYFKCTDYVFDEDIQIKSIQHAMYINLLIFQAQNCEVPLPRWGNHTGKSGFWWIFISNGVLKEMFFFCCCY